MNQKGIGKLLLNITETKQVPTMPQTPDGTITTQIDNQIFIMDVFFNHNSKETFEDKLLRVIQTEEAVTS